MAITATAVLSSVPASYRLRRKVAGDAEQQLRNLEQKSENFDFRQIAYGVLYADTTGRTTGTVSMALRRATAWQAASLVAAIANDGITLIRDVPAWLNANAMAVLS